MAEIAARYGRSILVWDVVQRGNPTPGEPGPMERRPRRLPGLVLPGGRTPLARACEALDQRRTSQSHVTTGQYQAMIHNCCGERSASTASAFSSTTRWGALFAPKPYAPDQLYSVYERLGRLCLPLWITEITIPHRRRRSGAPGRGGGQSLPAVVQHDGHGGRDLVEPGRRDGLWQREQGLGGLLDKDMNPKPAFQALDQLINRQWRQSHTHHRPGRQSPLARLPRQVPGHGDLGAAASREFAIDLSQAPRPCTG